jgi:hypothetical protein
MVSTNASASSRSLHQGRPWVSSEVMRRFKGSGFVYVGNIELPHIRPNKESAFNARVSTADLKAAVSNAKRSAAAAQAAMDMPTYAPDTQFNSNGWEQLPFKRSSEPTAPIPLEAVTVFRVTSLGRLYAKR